jgi:hypothetical protein
LKICILRGICEGIGSLKFVACQEYEGIGLFANCSVRGAGQGTFLLKVCNKREMS